MSVFSGWAGIARALLALGALTALLAWARPARGHAPSTDEAPPATQPAVDDPRLRVGGELLSDDFAHGTDRWRVELEKGGSVVAKDGTLTIDVPGGASVWFEPELFGPVLIEYDARVLDRGGPNDRVSDLNCFWMATDARNADDLFAVKRTGKFADYNELKCYYVGLGGNTNTTTRFRRYVGSPTTRPLDPRDDLKSPDVLLKPNAWQHVQLVAADDLIQYWRDGHKLFEHVDPEPYTRGRFALRTVTSHTEVRNFRVLRLARADR